MMPRVVIASLAALSLGCFVACGGEDGPRPERTDVPLRDANGQLVTTANAVDYCPLLAANDFQLILDFSGKVGTPVKCGTPVSGANCNSVYASYSLTTEALRAKPGTALAAEPQSGPPYLYAMEEGLCGQPQNAARIQVKRTAMLGPKDNPPDAGQYAPTLGAGWGAMFGIEFTFVRDTLEFWDVSGWDGVSFFLKSGPNGEGGGTSPVSFPDIHSTPDKRHGDRGCQDDALGNDVRTMCDPYGMSVAFSDTWQFFMMPFTAMKQRGYGMFYSRNDFLSEGLKQASGVKFEFTPTQDWDIWITQVAFYKKKAL